MISDAETGETIWGFEANMVSKIYATKVTRMLINSNKDLAEASRTQARALNWLTAGLVMATFLLVGATLLLVFVK